MDIEKRLADVRKRIDRANVVEAQNQVLRDNALAERERAMSVLKEEFDVETVEDAKKLAVKLQKQLDKKTAELEKLLDSLDA